MIPKQPALGLEAEGVGFSGNIMLQQKGTAGSTARGIVSHCICASREEEMQRMRRG
jgi:hypothetical protein